MGDINWFDVCGHAGDVSFALGGWMLARAVTENRLVWCLSGISTFCFGGAFLRDVLALGTQPAIIGDPWKLAAYCLFVTLLSLVFNGGGKKKNPFPRLGTVLTKVLVLLDSLGILAFAAFGFDRGMEINGSFAIAVSCGVCTAVGGGIIAALIRSAATAKASHFKETVIRNVPYYLYAVAVTLTYGILDRAGTDKTLAFNVLIPLNILAGFLTDYKISNRRG